MNNHTFVLVMLMSLSEKYAVKSNKKTQKKKEVGTFYRLTSFRNMK